jgi:hypothetical protein
MASTFREKSEDKSKPKPNHSVNGEIVTWQAIN